jgi:hypothetical protein
MLLFTQQKASVLIAKIPKLSNDIVMQKRKLEDRALYRRDIALSRLLSGHVVRAILQKFHRPYKMRIEYLKLHLISLVVILCMSSVSYATIPENILSQKKAVVTIHIYERASKCFLAAASL